MTRIILILRETDWPQYSSVRKAVTDRFPGFDFGFTWDSPPDERRTTVEWRGAPGEVSEEEMQKILSETKDIAIEALDVAVKALDQEK